jgi:putative redox protein
MTSQTATTKENSMPSRQRLNIANPNGEQLAAALELPDREPRAYVLFAHCFTCGKDSAAATRISRTLTAHGFAVLRFDFTGLGDSQGDFANSNFSSNVTDLIAAAAVLREQFAAPAILIGHSLGGTAVLAAAAEIPEVRAVVTIGSPASAEHVEKQFATSVAEIAKAGEARVQLGGREFLVKQQFLDDIRSNPIIDKVARLKKALLVMHAPMDAIVSVDQATSIFTAAKHPKSFVSLDSADHLLTRLEDAQYVANTITAWVDRYIDAAKITRPEVAGGEVHVSEGNAKFLREVTSDDHAWLADEPKRVGGDNLGPDPYEHLLAALGTCTSMTIRMYANHKQWPLESVDVQLEHSREHAEDCAHCDDQNARVDVLSRSIRLGGALDETQRARLLEIADRCPVHKTLEGELRVDTVEWR